MLTRFLHVMLKLSTGAEIAPLNMVGLVGNITFLLKIKKTVKEESTVDRKPAPG